jgi:hypothetical protein
MSKVGTTSDLVRNFLKGFADFNLLFRWSSPFSKGLTPFFKLLGRLEVAGTHYSPRSCHISSTQHTREVDLPTPIPLARHMGRTSRSKSRAERFHCPWLHCQCHSDSSRPESLTRRQIGQDRGPWHTRLPEQRSKLEYRIHPSKGLYHSSPHRSKKA